MRKATGLLAALILLLPTTTAAAAPSRLHPPGEATILVTGDRVMVRGNSFSIEPGKGRDRVTFTTKRVRGHLHVIPSDALIPLAEGRLDLRLFDVTAQAGRDLSLIVRPAGGRQLRGAKLTRSLPHLGLVSVQPHDRQALWADVLTSKTKVWLDGVLRPVLDTSVPQIGAPAAWQAGLTGAGVTMAVLDTGIDDTHPDLAGRVAGRMNFTEGTEDDRDTNGHGTHVASIMAGAKGVAPGANLLDAKVCVEWGCPESWVLAAMHWAVAQQRAKVVNLSLSGWDTPGIDPLEEAVDTLSAQFGTLFVIAAGNEGPFPSSVGTPGSADAALTVGAIDDAGEPASFSSRGPRLGDDGLKPDITAPGVDITAARSKDSPGAGSHVALSGTSMATPHVAGAAALLAQRHPQWTGGQLKAMLMASARPHATASVFTQGAGRVDVAAALTQRVYADPASIGFGMQLWPHGDDEPQTRQVTYHNTTTEAVTLDVSATGGVFAVGPARVTVPAGGTASVHVTADTRADVPDGLITGSVTATAPDGTAARTALAVHKEVESYTLTLEGLDRGGQASVFAADMFSHDSLRGLNLHSEDGTATARVAKGRYVLTSWVASRVAPEITLLVHPALDVTGDATVRLDARLGRTSSLTVPRVSAKTLFTDIAFTLSTPDGPISAGQGGRSFADFYTADLSGGAAVPGFISYISAVFGTSNADSPWTYTVGHREPRFISGYQRAFAEQEFAAIHTSYSGGDADGMLALWEAASSSLPDRSDTTPGAWVTYRLPGRAVHHVNVEPGMQWRTTLRRAWTDPDTGDHYRFGPIHGEWVSYRARQSYHDTWNRAVFGPALRAATRTGDTISVDAALYADGAGRLDPMEGTGSTTLWRNGVRVGSSATPGSGDFRVTGADARYTMKIESQRGEPHRLSTRTTVDWTFRSAHVAGSRPLPLPLVRFSPPLDTHNSAPAGSTLPIPLSVTGPARVNRIEVSFDDGATWTRAVVWATTLIVRHPPGTGFVSLRATASDNDGNTVDQTIIRAYRYA